MAQLGADVDALEATGSKMIDAAGQIQQLMGSLSGQISGTWWLGADADRFRAEWDGTHRPNLDRVVQALNDAGNGAKNQASQQRQTSGA
jgi:uncharacterized protein YukE